MATEPLSAGGSPPPLEAIEVIPEAHVGSESQDEDSYAASQDALLDAGDTDIRRGESSKVLAEVFSSHTGYSTLHDSSVIQSQSQESQEWIPESTTQQSPVSPDAKGTADRPFFNTPDTSCLLGNPSHLPDRSIKLKSETSEMKLDKLLCTLYSELHRVAWVWMANTGTAGNGSWVPCIVTVEPSQYAHSFEHRIRPDMTENGKASARRAELNDGSHRSCYEVYIFHSEGRHLLQGPYYAEQVIDYVHWCLGHANLPVLPPAFCKDSHVWVDTTNTRHQAMVKKTLRKKVEHGEYLEDYEDCDAEYATHCRICWTESPDRQEERAATTLVGIKSNKMQVLDTINRNRDQNCILDRGAGTTTRSSVFLQNRATMDKEETWKWFEPLMRYMSKHNIRSFRHNIKRETYTAYTTDNQMMGYNINCSPAPQSGLDWATPKPLIRSLRGSPVRCAQCHVLSNVVPDNEEISRSTWCCPVCDPESNTTLAATFEREDKNLNEKVLAMQTIGFNVGGKQLDLVLVVSDMTRVSLWQYVTDSPRKQFALLDSLELLKGGHISISEPFLVQTDKKTGHQEQLLVISNTKCVHICNVHLYHFEDHHLKVTRLWLELVNAPAKVNDNILNTIECGCVAQYDRNQHGFDINIHIITGIAAMQLQHFHCRYDLLRNTEPCFELKTEKSLSALRNSGEGMYTSATNRIKELFALSPTADRLSLRWGVLHNEKYFEWEIPYKAQSSDSHLYSINLEACRNTASLRPFGKSILSVRENLEKLRASTIRVAHWVNFAGNPAGEQRVVVASLKRNSTTHVSLLTACDELELEPRCVQTWEPQGKLMMAEFPEDIFNVLAVCARQCKAAFAVIRPNGCQHQIICDMTSSRGSTRIRPSRQPRIDFNMDHFVQEPYCTPKRKGQESREDPVQTPDNNARKRRRSSNEGTATKPTISEDHCVYNEVDEDHDHDTRTGSPTTKVGKINGVENCKRLKTDKIMSGCAQKHELPAGTMVHGHGWLQHMQKAHFTLVADVNQISVRRGDLLSRLNTSRSELEVMGDKLANMQYNQYADYKNDVQEVLSALKQRPTANDFGSAIDETFDKWDELVSTYARREKELSTHIEKNKNAARYIDNVHKAYYRTCQDYPLTSHVHIHARVEYSQFRAEMCEEFYHSDFEVLPVRHGRNSPILLNGNLKAQIVKIHKELMKQPQAADFNAPVPTIHKFYIHTVYKLMNLQSVLNLLNSDVYVSLEQYLADLDTIWGNAQKYNQRNSDVYRYSSELADHVARKIQENILNHLDKPSYAEEARLSLPKIVKCLKESIGYSGIEADGTATTPRGIVRRACLDCGWQTDTPIRPMGLKVLEKLKPGEVKGRSDRQPLMVIVRLLIEKIGYTEHRCSCLSMCEIVNLACEDLNIDGNSDGILLNGLNALRKLDNVGNESDVSLRGIVEDLKQKIGYNDKGNDSLLSILERACNDCGVENTKQSLIQKGLQALETVTVSQENPRTLMEIVSVLRSILEYTEDQACHKIIKYACNICEIAPDGNLLQCGLKALEELG